MASNGQVAVRNTHTSHGPGQRGAQNQLQAKKDSVNQNFNSASAAPQSTE